MLITITPTPTGHMVCGGGFMMPAGDRETAVAMVRGLIESEQRHRAEVRRLVPVDGGRIGREGDEDLQRAARQ